MSTESDAGTSIRLAANVLTAAIVVCALVYGREVLMPLSLAAMCAFMLTPVVDLLGRARIPRSVAVALVLLGTIGVAAAGSAVFSSQVVSLASKLGDYKENIVKKMAMFSSSGTQIGLIERAGKSIDAIQQALKTGGKAKEGEARPPRVVVSQAPGLGSAAVFQALRSVLGPAEIFLLMLTYTFVLLAENYDIRDRLVRLAGLEYLTDTTSALTDAGSQLSKLLLIQGSVNAAYGIAMAAVLFVLGVPNAALWGISAAVLRFMPFIGVIVAAVPPLLLAAPWIRGGACFSRPLAPTSWANSSFRISSSPRCMAGMSDCRFWEFSRPRVFGPSFGGPWAYYCPFLSPCV